MRRVTTLALFAGGTMAVVAGGALARARLMRRGLAIPKPVTGIFPNGMAYIRLGAGPKTLLWIPGGPGNVVPTGRLFQMMSASIVRPLLESGYTVWIVTRKQDMPKGYSVADMAEDYDGLIADEFGGKVDLVIGESTSGQIGFCLAARHPDRFSHLATVQAGYRLSDEGKALELDYARLMSEGRRSEAGALLVRFLYPDLRVPGVARILGLMLVRFLLGKTHPYFESDVMVGAEAIAAFDGRDTLPDISVPVLVVGCDRDIEFAKEVYEETARLIPDCTLRIYEGKTGAQVFSDRRLAQDVLDFVRQRPVVQQERRAEQPTTIDQPSATPEQPVGLSPVCTSGS